MRSKFLMGAALLVAPSCAQKQGVGDGFLGNDGGSQTESPDGGQTESPDGQNPVGQGDCTDTAAYVLADEGLFRFEPPSTFTRIGNSTCPTQNGLDTMALSGDGYAWITSVSGDLFRMNLKTGECNGTDFRKDQQGLDRFSMSFVSGGSVTSPTLYVIGTGTGKGFGTLDTGALTLHLLGSGDPSFAFGQLAGTGDGRLYSFTPGLAQGETSALGTVDLASGHFTSKVTVPLNLTSNYAIVFVAGELWAFFDAQLYKVNVTSGAATLVQDHLGLSVWAAAGPPCAEARTH
jgi:hypothetical protein